jgi:hypothetical protein
VEGPEKLGNRDPSKVPKLGSNNKRRVERPILMTSVLNTEMPNQVYSSVSSHPKKLVQTPNSFFPLFANREKQKTT